MKNNSTEINEAKNQALQTAISQIEKNFGKGSIMRLGEDAADKSVESVPTGNCLKVLTLPTMISPLSCLRKHP